jgi:hypothetical protein
MDRLRELSEGTLNTLVTNSLVFVALLCVILAFALYIYLVRPSLSEYFEDKKKPDTAPPHEKPMTAVE